MAVLQIKPKSECKWDALALGEILIRLDPGFERIRCTRNFRVWEGGGEYNVVRALRKCFGKKTAVVTAIVDNELGHLLEDLISQGGVDTSHVKWVPFDGIGKDARMGLNFTEKGYGIRPALGCSDRAHTAVSQLKKGDIDWNRIFNDEGVRWFHCGGIFAALSETTPEVVVEAMQCAKENGTIISYDLNYRASLWKSQGGKEKAVQINRSIAQYVDVMIGNEEDFSAALGFAVQGLDEHISKIDPANFKKMIGDIAEKVNAGEPVDVTMGHFNVIWQRDVNAAVIRSFGLASVPPAYLNVTGKEIYSIREAAKILGELLDKKPVFEGEESGSAFLSNPDKYYQLFGAPSLNTEQIIRRVAHWIKSGGSSLGKPTHFETRNGKF